jgi:hypothetical protein
LSTGKPPFGAAFLWLIGFRTTCASPASRVGAWADSSR